MIKNIGEQEMDKAEIIKSKWSKDSDPVDKVAVSTRLKLVDDRFLVLVDIDPTHSTNDDFLTTFPEGYHGLFEFDNAHDAAVCMKEINKKLGLNEVG